MPDSLVPVCPDCGGEGEETTVGDEATVAGERTYRAGQRVRSNGRHFAPVAGTVLGPAGGDRWRVRVRWERPTTTWGGALTTTTTALVADLEAIDGEAAG